MNDIPRRRWLQQCALAAAGLALPAIATARTGRAGRLPGEGKAPIRLSANENPYGPGPMALAALRASAEAGNRYGFALADEAKGAIAAYLGVKPEQVKLTAGSSEMLGIIGMYWALRKGSGLTCVPTFDICFRQAEKWGLSFGQLPLTAAGSFDLDALGRRLRSKQLVYICNPNNPTGGFIPQADILAFHQRLPADSLLVVDEAYLDYAEAESLAQHTASRPNLIVVRTFSKAHGLAGARIGYAVGHPALMEQLADFQAWNNATLSVPALHAAMASLKDTDFLRQTVTRNKEQRNLTVQALAGLGLRVLPSHTNFIHVGDVPANWTSAMEARGIITGRTTDNGTRWSRVTIGKPEEMAAFLEAAKQIVKP